MRQPKPDCTARRIHILACVVACGSLLSSIVAQERISIQERYTKTEHEVAMRDGVKLFTQVYTPKDEARKYPVMMLRTPYGIRAYGKGNFRRSLGPSALFARSGYIFVYQDVRGKFRSEGEFEVMRPVRSKLVGKGEIDESTDTYDTIQWVLDNVPNHNGRVGMWGISYPGFQVVMGMIDAHPALAAASPQASPADMFIGDDFHHNGAFRLMYTFGWLSGNAAVRTGKSSTRQSARFSYGTPDGYDFFLRLGPLTNVDRLYFQKRVPTWNEYMQHGSYDDYWKQQDVLQHMKNIKPAVLNVAGWFDAEDFYGPMGIYYAIEKNDAKNRSSLVVGPWRHGGWARGSGESLGNIHFGSSTSEHYRQKVEFPFFEHHLKQARTEPLAEAIVFETGRNEWRTYDHWPPRKAKEKRLYLHANGALSLAPPAALPAGFDEFTSDPARPVPFSAEIRTSQGHDWMIEDQRFASRRPDVLVYQTEPLEKDLVIAGPIIASLQVSTTGTDADWIVKLIDVLPGDARDRRENRGVRMGGFQMLLAGEVFRSKFRDSFEHPKPMVPGEITKITFDLRDKCHCFLKGHRIMVQIQSTWFPVIDRNPQKFVDIYHAKASDFQKATHRVHRSGSNASFIKLGVLE